MRFCARCNQMFDDSTGFCTSCGGPLGIMPQPQPQYVQQMPQQMPQMQGQMPQMQGQMPQYGQPMQYGAYVPAKKPINKAAIIIPIVAVVVIGVTFLVLFLTGVLGGPDKLIGSWTDGEFIETFNSDGTGIQTHAYYSESYPFTWKKSGNTLAITMNGDTVEVTIVSLTDNEFVFDRDDGSRFTLRKTTNATAQSASNNAGGYGYDYDFDLDELLGAML